MMKNFLSHFRIFDLRFTQNFLFRFLLLMLLCMLQLVHAAEVVQDSSKTEVSAIHVIGGASIISVKVHPDEDAPNHTMEQKVTENFKNPSKTLIAAKLAEPETKKKKAKENPPTPKTKKVLSQSSNDKGGAYLLLSKKRDLISNPVQKSKQPMYRTRNAQPESALITVRMGSTMGWLSANPAKTFRNTHCTRPPPAV